MKTFLRQYYVRLNDGPQQVCGSCGKAQDDLQGPVHADNCPVDRLESLQVMVLVSWDASSVGDATSVHETKMFLCPNHDSAREEIGRWARAQYGNIPEPRVDGVLLVDSALLQQFRDQYLKLIVDVQERRFAEIQREAQANRAGNALVHLRKDLTKIAPLERVSRIASFLTQHESFLAASDIEDLRTQLKDSAAAC